MKRLILASTSPRRKMLMEKLSVPFEVIPSSYEEDMTMALRPALLAETLARGKAENVARRFSTAVVIGSDTLIAFEGGVLGKPKDASDAVRTLLRLSGKTHEVITGYCVIEGEVVRSGAVSSKVLFRDLSKDEIERYVATGEPLDRAASYAIQGGARDFVVSTDGDYDTIVGLPVFRLRELLPLFGIEVS